jgi:hypothetical protein
MKKVPPAALRPGGPFFRLRRPGRRPGPRQRTFWKRFSGLSKTFCRRFAGCEPKQNGLRLNIKLKALSFFFGAIRVRSPRQRLSAPGIGLREWIRCAFLPPASPFKTLCRRFAGWGHSSKAPVHDHALSFPFSFNGAIRVRSPRQRLSAPGIGLREWVRCAFLPPASPFKTLCRRFAGWGHSSKAPVHDHALSFPFSFNGAIRVRSPRQRLSALGIGLREWVRCAFSSGRGNRSVAVYVRIGAAGKNVQMARYRKPPPADYTRSTVTPSAT